jgi:Domain of unknown function (DUF5679)
VNSAEYDEIRGRLFGRRISGISFNGMRAAVALPSSTMIRLGRRLANECGSIGPEALYQEGREYVLSITRELDGILAESADSSEIINLGDQEREIPVSNSIEAYCVKCRRKQRIESPRQVLLSNKTHALQGVCPVCSTTVFKIGARIYGKIRGGALIENTIGFLMTTGWGFFEIRSSLEGRSAEVSISDPPVLDGEINYGNQFVEGMAAGLLEVAAGIGNRMALVGQQYDSQANTLCLRFAEKIPRIKPAGVSGVKRIGENPDRKSITQAASAEVDRIINSLEKIESEAMKAAKESDVGLTGREETEEEETTPGPIII